jgi:hypothetical protein
VEEGDEQVTCGCNIERERGVGQRGIERGRPEVRGGGSGSSQSSKSSGSGSGGDRAQKQAAGRTGGKASN